MSPCMTMSAIEELHMRYTIPSVTNSSDSSLDRSSPCNDIRDIVRLVHTVSLLI